MTVKELRKFLDLYHEDFPVFMRGYEGGYCDVEKIFLARMKKNVNKEWWNGPHEMNNEDYDVEGVVIE